MFDVISHDLARFEAQEFLAVEREAYIESLVNELLDGYGKASRRSVEVGDSKLAFAELFESVDGDVLVSFSLRVLDGDVAGAVELLKSHLAETAFSVIGGRQT